MENTTEIRITKRDYKFAIAAGLLIGSLLLPILKSSKPEIFAKFWIIIIPFFLLATPLGLRISFYIGQKIAVVYQIAKFGVIGVSNVLVDLGVLSLITVIFATKFNISSDDVIFKTALFTLTFYSIFKGISFIVANINSYLWNKHWTFDQGNNKQSKAEIVQFFAVSIVGFIINVIVASLAFSILKGTHNDLSLTQLAQFGILGAMAGSIAGLAWNFVGYKLWVFKK